MKEKEVMLKAIKTYKAKESIYDDDYDSAQYALMGRTLAQIKEFNGVPIKRLIELSTAKIEKGVNGK